MQRITRAFLQAQIDNLNRLTGSPAQPYVKGEDDRFHAQPGNYHLSGAYGGYSLHRMSNDAGGVRDVFGCGHVPARSLADRMHAFLAGLDAQR